MTSTLVHLKFVLKNKWVGWVVCCKRVPLSLKSTIKKKYAEEISRWISFSLYQELLGPPVANRKQNSYQNSRIKIPRPSCLGNVNEGLALGECPWESVTGDCVPGGEVSGLFFGSWHLMRSRAQGNLANLIIDGAQHEFNWWIRHKWAYLMNTLGSKYLHKSNSMLSPEQNYLFVCL